jgi:hypothetical protein
MNPKLIKAIIDEAKSEITTLAAAIAAETATKTTIAEWDKRWREKQSELRNKRLWNTRMLLKHYNSLKRYCENAVYDKETAAMSDSPVKILESLGCCSKDMYIESIKSNVVRTQTIMAHVDAILNVYRIICETSEKEEERRRYCVLYSSYFTSETRDAICQIENIDKSTYYRDMKCSTEMLSALIFGLDGLIAMRNN